MGQIGPQKLLQSSSRVLFSRYRYSGHASEFSKAFVRGKTQAHLAKMVVVHIVLFKFRGDTSEDIKATFIEKLQKLKDLPCVLNHNLIVGGPSITTPIARSQGFHYCLLSYHKDRAALDEYQASTEHHDVTSKWMWPFNEDLIRFDFETDLSKLNGVDPFLLSAGLSSNTSDSSAPTPSTLSATSSP